MINNKQLSLTDIPLRSPCQVHNLEAKGLTRRRLLDLGLVPGTIVTKLRKSPIGDPSAFSIRGATIALRKEEGKCVIVSPLLERIE